MQRIENPADFEICKFDGVSSAAVYVGFFDGLKNVTDMLKWRVSKEGSEMCYDPYEILSLAEIREQLKPRIITVFDVGPLAGRVYQTGNYSDGGWYQVGDLDGYV